MNGQSPVSNQRCVVSWSRALVVLALVAHCGVALVNAESEKKAPAASPKADKKPSSALDDELLKDLGGDPADELPPAKPKPSANNQPPPTSPSKRKASELDDELLKGLGDDGPAKSTAPEDADNPLVQLNRKMREVEALIRQSRADQPTQEKQAAIVQELEQLIKQLEQQAQQSGGSKPQPRQSQQQSSARSQSKPSASQPKPGSGSGKPSDQPASDSSEQLTKRGDRKPDAARMQELLKDVWGELPARLREQMMQANAEKFLPKYELLIEDYFKALSEKQRDYAP